jgi:glucan biosynthesis protein C
MPDHKPVEHIVYLDHLRAALVILVVLHHLALVYGAAAPFYYVEPPFRDPFAGLVLLVFVLFNQAWFMGALFLVAGYFTPESFDRRGAAVFLKARLLRLGVPTLAWIFALAPLSSIGFFLMPTSLTGITEPLSWSAYPALLGLGPAWFIAMLLIFDLGYAAWRRVAPHSTAAETRIPRYWSVGLFIVALALTGYLIRIVVLLGKDVHLYAYFLSFPTIAYLPQYLAFFVLGIAASRHGWLRKLPDTFGWAGLIAAVSAAILLFPPAVSGRPFSLQFAEPARFVGGGTWQSAVYALWDSVTAVGLSLSSITLFRSVFDGNSRRGHFLSENSYAVYIIHVPIVVFIAFAIRDIDLAPLAKFALAAVIIVPICFGIASLLRKMRWVAQVV